MSSLLKDEVYAATGIEPFVGLLNHPGDIDPGNKLIIDELPLDYSILEEIDYVYPANNAYFAYMTRGCVNKCKFCAVPKLEPQYCDYINLKNRIEFTDKRFGARKDLLLLDNNVLASKCYDQIIDEIKECGFGTGATYTPPNEYDVTINNLKDSFPMKYHPINDKEFFMNRDYIGKHWNRKFIRAVQAVLNSTKGKIGRGVDFFEEAFGRDIDEFMKILWMPETFIIYRRIYDADLRNRLADRYTTVTKHDCDLTNEWWEKFKALPPDKLEKAKAIIALNKFKDGDFVCDDKEINDVLAYYKITRDDTENNQ